MRTKEEIIKEIEETTSTKLQIQEYPFNIVYRFYQKAEEFCLYKIWLKKWDNNKCSLEMNGESEYYGTTKILKLFIELMEVLESEK